ETVCDGFDHGAESLVGVGFAEVGEVAGEDDGVDGEAALGELGEGLVEVAVGVDGTVEGAFSAEEVGVADVGDDVAGCGVLAEVHHATQPRLWSYASPSLRPAQRRLPRVRVARARIARR